MSTIAEIFRSFAPEYIERFGNSMPDNHKKVIDSIINCRTEACGTSVYLCLKCKAIHYVYQSCGNRHCPVCQNHKTIKWYEKQMERQLPGHYFMITVTVPECLRDFIRSNQSIAYSALFKASAEAIKKLTKDDKYIGGDVPGFFGVLHTWGSLLQYHPHIHFVVPGGAVSTEDDQWHPSRADFFLPVKALSKIIKAKFQDEMKKNGVFDNIPQKAWKKDWNIHSKAAGNGENVIAYLSRYVFKVAISDSRIIKVDNRKVVFEYKKKNSNRMRTCSLDVMEFIRRFLQHVLPSGFMKVRYYGFLNSNCRITIEHVSTLIEIAYGFAINVPLFDKKTLKPLSCEKCGGELEFQYFIIGGAMESNIDSS